MGKKKKQLSQAEIWDDSALLDSWNEALAEYKLYHSIHARGERVEDVIKAAEAESQDPTITVKYPSQAALMSQTDGVLLEDLEEGELEEEPENAATFNTSYSNDALHEPITSLVEHIQHPPELGEASTAQEHPGKAAMPNVVMNGVQDEALKNLMMSWYYAGYYSGLYEGQQRAQNNPLN